MFKPGEAAEVSPVFFLGPLIMIYVHAYPFRVDDPERNIRGITTAAKDKALNAGDVLLFPFHALSGTVEDFWTSRPENRESNAH